MKKYNSYKLAAMATVAMMASSKASFAAAATGGGFSTISENIVQSSSQFPNLISLVSYIGGLGLGVAGVFKLKQHVDNPGQTPMKDGLVRLGVGGALLTLPALTNAMTQTVDGGTAGTALSPSDLAFSAATFP